MVRGMVGQMPISRQGDATGTRATVTRRVRQGAPSCPIVFNMHIDSLVVHVEGIVSRREERGSLSTFSRRYYPSSIFKSHSTRSAACRLIMAMKLKRKHVNIKVLLFKITRRTEKLQCSHRGESVEDGVRRNVNRYDTTINRNRLRAFHGNGKDRNTGDRTAG